MGLSDSERPHRLTNDTRQQFLELGVRGLPDAPDEEDDDVFELWDSNEKAGRLFLALSTQWRRYAVAGFGVVRVVMTGIDYATVPIVQRALGYCDPKGELFSDLQAMENAALAAFAEGSR